MDSKKNLNDELEKTKAELKNVVLKPLPFVLSTKTKIIVIIIGILMMVSYALLP